jgi:uncharacterized membrane protein
MTAILTSLTRTVVAGCVLAFILFVLYAAQVYEGSLFWRFLFRWLHVISGIMWVGLIWFVNVVQIPNMGRIPDEQKPAIGRVIAPAVLWWFRWTALATVVTGLVLATLNGYAAEALSLGLVDGVARHGMIGVGMWLGLVMAFNVWFILWPNQRRALGLVEADADGRTRSARRALLVARINNLLSLPMLFAMVAAQNLF